MNSSSIFSMSISSSTPAASAVVYGNSAYPSLLGIVNFYKTKWDMGLMVEAEFSGLPNLAKYSPRFLGMHIHENGDCRNNFANTGMHYNPTGADHPYHLGDLPSILNSNGYAFLIFYDSFLSLDDIKGRSLVLHNKRDNFTTQPSGDSGDKIACGVII